MLIKLPLPYYGPDDEGKSAAQLEREKIKVTSVMKTDDLPKKDEETNENNMDEDIKEPEKEETEETKEEVDEDDKEEENEIKEEEQELTADQKQIKALERKIERLNRRVGKTVGERDDIRKQLKEAQIALEAKLADGEQPLTKEEVDRRAREIADQELTAREFNQAQEKLIKDATKIDKNFMTKINELAQEVAPLPAFFVGALNDLDNGGAVLNYLSDNHDEYEDLLSNNSPMKIMKGLINISNKLIEDAKPKPKKISNAPEPPKAPKGNSSSPDILPAKPTENMAEFVRLRNKQEAEKRKARMGG